MEVGLPLGPLELIRCATAVACCIRVVDADRDDGLGRCSIACIGSHSCLTFCLEEWRAELEVFVCLGLRTAESSMVGSCGGLLGSPNGRDVQASQSLFSLKAFDDKTSPFDWKGPGASPPAAKLSL